MKALLEVENLHYYYNGIHAVKGLSFNIQEGEIVTLVGANGAGKTTILRAISGILDSKGLEGNILFNGKRINNFPAYKTARSGIAHVLEGRHIFPQMTVYENIEVGTY